MVHVKVRTKTKRDAQKVAKRLGVSLSLVAERAFRDFALDKQLMIEEPLKPTPYLEKILREAKKNRDNPKFWSGPFTSADEIERHLRGLMKGKK